MTTMVPTPADSNPLARLANAVPNSVAIALSYGGRSVGALLALYVAYDQVYDRSQAFGVSVAVLALLSLAPVPRRFATVVSALGGSLILFGGALLWSESAGPWMVLAGAAAVCGALVSAQHGGRRIGDAISGLFFGSGVDAALVFAIIFLVEG